MPEEMLRKKRLEINLTKEEVKDKKEHAYLNAMRYEELKASEKRLGSVFDMKRERNDAAVLWKPAFKAKAALKLFRNLNIEKGKLITPDATAFTYEIHDQIHSIDDLLSKDYVAINGIPLTGLIQRLSSVHFSRKMLLPSVIRANFKDYITLVREWERYGSMEKTDGETLPAALEELYEIFYRGVSLYCRQNRINLNGTPMKEGEMLKNSEELTKDEVELFSTLSKEYDNIKEKKAAEDPELEPIHFEKDELQRAEKKPSEEDMPREDPNTFISKLKEMQPKERALLFPSMKQLDLDLKERIKENNDPRQKAILQKSEQLLSCWIEYTELQIKLAKDPENKPLWKRQRDYLTDLRLLEKRNSLPVEPDIIIKNPAMAAEDL